MADDIRMLPLAVSVDKCARLLGLGRLSFTHKSKLLMRNSLARRESRVILCPAPILERCDGRGWGCVV